MVNRGSPDVRVKRDRWTVVTVDGSASAHFERSIAVMEGGPWILAEPRKQNPGTPGSEEDHV